MTNSPHQVAPADFRYAVSELLNKMTMHEIACASEPDRKEATAAAVVKARQEVEAMLDAVSVPSTDALEAARYRDILEHVSFVPSGISGTFGLNYRAPTNWREYASDEVMFAAVVDASRGKPSIAAEDAGNADKLAAAFNSAVDAEYPLPDSPHASVVQRAIDNRAAMWRGINAARKIFAAQGDQAPANVTWMGEALKVAKNALEFYRENNCWSVTFARPQRENDLEFLRKSPDWSYVTEDGRGHEQYYVTSHRADEALRKIDDLEADASDAADAQSISAHVWKRESTSEWVLELGGSINGVAFTSRHTEPLSTPLEDVPGLPTLHAANEANKARNLVVDDVLRSARELARLVANTSGTPSLASEASRVVRKIDAVPGAKTGGFEGSENG